MTNPLICLKNTVILTAALLAPNSAPAAVVGMDFATNLQSGSTDAYTSVQLPESIASGGWQHLTGDWSSTAVTIPAGAVSLKSYWDASKTWYNNNTGSPSSPFRGYLDDGAYDSTGSTTSWAVEVSGLSAWLAANNSTEWHLVILRSSDTAAGGFRDISIHTGTTAELTSIGLINIPSADWFTNPMATSVVDDWPAGGTAATITNGTAVNTGGNSRTAETNVFVGNSDAFIIRDTGIDTIGGQRGSIAGLILYTVPEPSASVLAAMTLVGLASRRRH